MATPRPRGDDGSGIALAREAASNPLPKSTTITLQTPSRTVRRTSQFSSVVA